MKKLVLIFIAIFALAFVAARGADTTNFTPVARALTINTNGVVITSTNANQTVTLNRGSSNMMAFEVERSTYFKPLYFPNSAKESVSSLGTEKLSNSGFELLTTAGMPTNWFPTVNFGDFAKSTQARTGTNGLICTNSTIYAVDFGGSDYVLGDTNERYTIAVVVHRQGSAECWIKLNALPATKAIVFEKVNKYDSTKSISMQITSSGKVQMRFHGGGSGYDQTVDSSFILSVGNWYHVAVTFDLLGLSAVFYLNGVPHTSVISHADGIYPSDSHYVIGYSTNDSNYGLNGSLSEIRIWDHVRNDAQILTNYLTRLSGSETGLVHCWTANEASGTIIDDKVSGAANATFAAAPNDPAWVGISSSVYSEPVLVTPGTNMQISLYYYGDGSNIGRYGVYDPINAQWVLTMRNLPSALVEWKQATMTFTVPNNTTYLEAVLSGPTAGYTIFDDVSLKNAGTTSNPYALMIGTAARYVDELWWSGERLLQASMTGVLFTNWTGYSSGLINGYMSGGNATNLTLFTATTAAITTATIGSATVTNLTGLGGSLTNMSSVQSTNIITPNLTATGGSLTNFGSIHGTNITGTFTGALVPLLSSNAPGAQYQVAYIPGSGVSIQSNMHWNLPHKFTNDSVYIGPEYDSYNGGGSNIFVGSKAGYAPIEYIERGASNILLQSSTFIDDVGTNFQTIQFWFNLTNTTYTTGQVINLFSIGTGTNKIDGRLVYHEGLTNSLYYTSMTNWMQLELERDSRIVHIVFAPTIALTNWCFLSIGMYSPGVDDVSWATYDAYNGYSWGYLPWDEGLDPVFYRAGSDSTDFVIHADVCKIANLRVWNSYFSRYDTTGYLYKYIFDAHDMIWSSYVLINIQPYLTHAYIYHNDTTWFDTGNRPSDLTVNGTFKTIDNRLNGSVFPTHYLRRLNRDTSTATRSGFIGQHATWTATNDIDNAWAIGRNAEVEESNTLAIGGRTYPMNLNVSGYIKPALGYKSTNGNAGLTATKYLYTTNLAGAAITNTVTIENGIITGWSE